MILVLSTFAGPEDAKKAARTLVAERLAACGTIVPGATSVYRWKGAIAEETEALLLLKARSEDWGALCDRLGQIHPYETPEIVALPPSAVTPRYAAWLREETAR